VRPARPPGLAGVSSIALTPIAEPATLALLAAASGLALRRRRRR